MKKIITIILFSSITTCAYAVSEKVFDDYAEIYASVSIYNEVCNADKYDIDEVGYMAVKDGIVEKEDYARLKQKTITVAKETNNLFTQDKSYQGKWCKFISRFLDEKKFPKVK